MPVESNAFAEIAASAVHAKAVKKTDAETNQTHDTIEEGQPVRSGMKYGNAGAIPRFSKVPPMIPKA